MIDTDKYEGHSVGKWRVRTRKGTFTVKDCLGDEVAAVNDYADARLIADAPLLLAEVKRLREEVEQWESLARAYAKILKSTNLPQELIE
tara:strand:- start:195 stop:461 length:267 start_codon:yes stop_codon:yes gene_type:complete